MLEVVQGLLLLGLGTLEAGYVLAASTASILLIMKRL